MLLRFSARTARIDPPWNPARRPGAAVLAALLIIATGSWARAGELDTALPAATSGESTCCEVTPAATVASAPTTSSAGVSWLFDTSGFPRRWNCGTWSQPLGWLHIVSDTVIWAAYMAIPVVLGFFLFKRRTPLPLVTWLFIAFIASCGIGHLIEAIIFWHPVYRLAGVWKLITAVVSCLTVAALIPVVPRILKWPTLNDVSTRLQAEIEERRVAERKLEESATELTLQQRALDEHAIVAITDPAGVITYVNDKFCSISGYEREELLGQTHRIINSGHHPKSFFVEMWRTIAQGRIWRDEVCNRAKDGSIYWVDTTIVPFKNRDGTISRYVAIRADITDRKIAEQRIEQANDELASANAEMEQFVYTVSHDLKSPLVTIQGYTGFLRQDLRDERTDRLAQHAEQISSATRRMRETIDDLLELSRVGRVTHEMESVDVAALAARLLVEMSIQIEDADASVTIEDDLPEIWADGIRIAQALENLLANALKYARCGDRRCEITIGATRVEGETRLFVRDNGPGVPEEYHERIFSLFQRLETEAEGTGIGLTIVKRVAEMHGGRAWVESTPGEGATFAISIPEKPPAAPSAEAA